MVLFIPGYTLIAALFPRKDDLDGIERVALSFGLSIAVVPLMGLGLNYTPWGIRLTPVVISISIFTIAMAAAAYFRRISQPQDAGFSVDFGKGLGSIKAELMAGEKSRLDKALTILLILSIILSVLALVYVIVTPKQGEKFTEFYILGMKGKAYDYPTHVVAGNSSSLIVGVVNHEYAEVNYTMGINFDNSTLLQQKIELDHNQTWEHPVSYILRHPGDEQKLEFLLYKENNFTAPYRDLHLWVNVSGDVPKNTSRSESKNVFEGQQIAQEAPKVRQSSIALETNLVPGNSGSGSDGGSSSSAERVKQLNKSNASEALGSGQVQTSSANLSENNTSKIVQNINASYNNTILLESNRSEIAQSNNISYNGMVPDIQANQGNNRIVPTKLGGETPRESIVLGGANKTQMMELS